MDFNYNDVVQPINGFIMKVTPEVAAMWLDKNISNNRNPKKTSITAYAEDMVNGNWGLSPDAIAFDQNGILFNGQNRLNAIVKSGVTINAFVVFGFPMHKKDFLNLDNGAKRTFRDMIRTGYSDDEAVILGGDIASAYIRVKYGVKAVTPNMRIDFVHTNRDIIMWTAKLCRHSVFGFKGTYKKTGSPRIPAIIAIAIMDAYMCGENEDVLETFVRGYCDNCFNGLSQKQVDYLMELRGIRNYTQNKEMLVQAKSYLKAFAKQYSKRYVTGKEYPADRLKLRADD